MGGLFTKKTSNRTTRVTEHDRAVLQLKQQRDKLKQYKQRINSKLDQERLLAKKLLDEGKKDKALLLLRKKRFQENLLERTDAQLNNIEQLTQDLEFAQVQQKVLAGLEEGNKALKTLHECMSLERVEQIMDETRESVEYQQEIDALVSGGLSSSDECEIEKELAGLLDEHEKEDEALHLPKVPTDEINQAEVGAVKLNKRKEKKNRVMEAS